MVEERKPVSFSIRCPRYDEPQCVYSCQIGALHSDPLSGIVSIDEKVPGCMPSYPNEALVVLETEDGEGEAK